MARRCQILGQGWRSVYFLALYSPEPQKYRKICGPIRALYNDLKGYNFGLGVRSSKFIRNVHHHHHCHHYYNNSNGFYSNFECFLCVSLHVKKCFTTVTYLILCKFIKREWRTYSVPRSWFLNTLPQQKESELFGDMANARVRAEKNLRWVWTSCDVRK